MAAHVGHEQHERRILLGVDGEASEGQLPGERPVQLVLLHERFTWLLVIVFLLVLILLEVAEAMGRQLLLGIRTLDVVDPIVV